MTNEIRYTGPLFIGAVLLLTLLLGAAGAGAQTLKGTRGEMTHARAWVKASATRAQVLRKLEKEGFTCEAISVENYAAIRCHVQAPAFRRAYPTELYFSGGRLVGFFSVSLVSSWCNNTRGNLETLYGARYGTDKVWEYPKVVYGYNQVGEGLGVVCSYGAFVRHCDTDSDCSARFGGSY